jgi:hypothetical protein
MPRGYRAAVAYNQEIGQLLRSVSAPAPAPGAGIKVLRVDLHENGFVVHSEIGSGAPLPEGLVALSLRDSLSTPYERVESGPGYIAYRPAILAEAEWLKIFTKPETHIDLGPAA